VREIEGQIFLYIKTIERSHTPANMWERIALGKNYATAIKIIDENLQYWPKFYLHKCKQRLTRIHQYLIRMRKIRMSVQPKLVRVHHKSEKRDLIREKKAEKAAKITRAIEQELLARLNDPEVDVYEGIYNFPQKEFKKVVERVGEADLEPGERQEEEEEEEEGEQELEFEMEQELEHALQEDMQAVGRKELVYDEFVADEDDDDIEEGGSAYMSGRFGDVAEDFDEEEEEKALQKALLERIRAKRRLSDAAPSEESSNKAVETRTKKGRRAHIDIGSNDKGKEEADE
jgi:protein MAK16